MFLRRSAAALAATTVLCAVAAPLATATPASAIPATATPATATSATAAATLASPALGGRAAPAGAVPADTSGTSDEKASGADAGLYGDADPTYDGVWRQSLALLAQDTAGVTPAKKAVDWLLAQQCDDGSFASYRPDPDAPCGEKTVADTNATAAAVQALAALGGHGKAVAKAVDWLASVQNEDGGWGYNPGSPSDANSVSVVIGALVAAGEDPARTTAGDGGDGATPYDALLDFRLDCDTKAENRGAFAYQPDEKGALAPNADATAAAVLAAQGEGFVVEPPARGRSTSPKKPSCDGDAPAGEPDAPQAAAEAGAAYLAGLLKRHDRHLMSALPGSEDKPDFGNTADAVIALAAGGHGEAARGALGWLEKHLGDWDAYTSSPAALGQLVLAVHAAGADPRDFGGVDLVKRLNATGPKPAAVAQPQADAGGDGEDGDGTGDKGGTDGEDGESTFATLSTVGAFLVAGIGIGILISGRNRRKSRP